MHITQLPICGTKVVRCVTLALALPCVVGGSASAQGAASWPGMWVPNEVYGGVNVPGLVPRIVFTSGPYRDDTLHIRYIWYNTGPATVRFLRLDRTAEEYGCGVSVRLGVPTRPVPGAFRLCEHVPATLLPGDSAWAEFVAIVDAPPGLYPLSARALTDLGDVPGPSSTLVQVMPRDAQNPRRPMVQVAGKEMLHWVLDDRHPRAEGDAAVAGFDDTLAMVAGDYFARPIRYAPLAAERDPTPYVVVDLGDAPNHTPVAVRWMQGKEVIACATAASAPHNGGTFDADLYSTLQRELQLFHDGLCGHKNPTRGPPVDTRSLRERVVAVNAMKADPGTPHDSALRRRLDSLTHENLRQLSKESVFEPKGTGVLIRGLLTHDSVGTFWTKVNEAEHGVAVHCISGRCLVQANTGDPLVLEAGQQAYAALGRAAALVDASGDTGGVASAEAPPAPARVAPEPPPKLVLILGLDLPGHGIDSTSVFSGIGRAITQRQINAERGVLALMPSDGRIPFLTLNVSVSDDGRMTYFSQWMQGHEPIAGCEHKANVSNVNASTVTEGVAKYLAYDIAQYPEHVCVKPGWVKKPQPSRLKPPR